MAGRSLPRRLVSVAAKDVLLSVLYPRIYAREAKNEVAPGSVLFVETRFEQMPESFKCAWEAFEGSSTYHREYFSLKRKDSSFGGFMRNCIEAVRKIATAEYVFLNDASDLISCLPLRPETKVIQLWHACGAFKKWGMSTAEKTFGGSSWEKERHPFYENLDLVTVSSPEVVWAYEEAMALGDRPGIVQPLGVSRTDVFYDKTFLADAQAELAKRVPQLSGRKIMLYAPTFRGTTDHPTGPDFLDIEALASALSSEYVLLIKHHPLVTNIPAIPPECQDFAFNVGDMAIDILLSVADVCITDYSSIVFEYSLFERPIAFLAPDIHDYDDWRGFYYDYDELTPGPVLATTEELIAWVASLQNGFDSTDIARFKQRFMSACDGHATERILARIGITP